MVSAYLLVGIVYILEIAIPVTFVMSISNVKGGYAKAISIVHSITVVRIHQEVVQMQKQNVSLVKKAIVRRPAIALLAGNAI
jgi:hypothetical protein